jgi:RNA polymerase sigma-70 factor (ECF subfamily)
MEQQQQPLISEQLYIAYYPRVVNFIRALARCSYEEAEDLAQDTFIKAIQALSTVDTTRPLLPWLYQIAKNTTYDALRRKQRAHVKGAVMLEHVEYAVSDGSNLEEEVAIYESVQCALQALSPRYRDILLLWGIGYSCKDIAGELGLSLGNTKVLLGRARATFKLHYEEVSA